jgi:hypothetical protein
MITFGGRDSEQVFAIRYHGRRFARYTPLSCYSNKPGGHRPLTWTPHFADAEKFSSREAAEHFAQRLNPGYEVFQHVVPDRPLYA